MNNGCLFRDPITFSSRGTPLQSSMPKHIVIRVACAVQIVIFPVLLSDILRFKAQLIVSMFWPEMHLCWCHHSATFITFVLNFLPRGAISSNLGFWLEPLPPVFQHFPVFCVWALERSIFCLGTCILFSLRDPVRPLHPHPWVGCDPACLQPLQVTNSHPAMLVILGMYFSVLSALCPFLEFSRSPTGHRSAYQTEAADKNSHWYIGHLKILAPVRSYLRNTLFCRETFGNFWHFPPANVCRNRSERLFCSDKKRAWWCRCLFLVCNLILLRKCQCRRKSVWTSDSPGP